MIIKLYSILGLLLSFLFIIISHLDYSEAQIIEGYPLDINNAELACQLRVCSSTGGLCNSGNTTTGYECYVQDRCLNGICTKSMGLNQKCNISDDCDLGLSCIPTNNGKYCGKAFFAEYNESCNSSIECINGLECINNICLTPTIGCFSDLQCKNNSICLKGKCEEYTLQENECFIFRPYACKGFSSCTLRSLNVSSIGVCKRNVTEGSPCLTNKYSCAFELNQYCKPLKPGSPIGTCIRTGTNKFQSCISRKGCNENEYCKCDAQSGVGYCVIIGTFVGTYCREASRLYVDCFYNSNCTQPFTQNPYSCMKSKCFEESQCFNSLCVNKLLPFNICSHGICNLPLINVSNVREISLNIGNLYFRKSSFLFNSVIIFIILLI